MADRPDLLTEPPQPRAMPGEQALPLPTGLRAKPPGADDYGEQDESGVDLSLLRYMLRLSPLERLQQMDRHARDTQVLMEYGRRHRQAPPATDR
jgi:hypothetical protein